jgi:sugar phosphate isomerase/epimerase
MARRPAPLPGGAPAHRFALNQVMMPNTSFEEDLAACVEAGYGGLSINEFKVPAGRETELAELMRASGVNTALLSAIGPLYDPLFKGYKDPAARLAHLRDTVERLTPFEPDVLAMHTGAPDDTLPENGMRHVIEVLKVACDMAGERGMSVVLEPLANAPEYSIITRIDEAVAVADRVGAPNLGVLIDISNVNIWTADGLLADLRTYRDRVGAVQIADRKAAPRSGMDRALPGQGIADFPAILRQLEEGGYQGWYDLEIFSDDGSWFEAFEDSLLHLEEAELLRQAWEGFDTAWRAAFAGSTDPEQGPGQAQFAPSTQKRVGQ